MKSSKTRKIDAQVIDLYHLFNGAEEWRIPYNQRPYTWDKKNWEPLWISLFGDEDDFATYLGTWILCEIFDEGGNLIEHEIYDGQQRITTLTIMFKAFSDEIQEIAKKNESTREYDFARRVFKLITGGMADEPRLRVTDKLRGYFEKNIQSMDLDFYSDKERTKLEINKGEDDVEKLIHGAYTFFRQMVSKLYDSYADVEQVYNLLLNRLKQVKLTLMTIDDVLVGIEIFESVNYGGVELNAADLAKNIIMKHADKLEREKQEIDLAWNEINERLAKTKVFSFIEFMYYYWISKYGYSSKKNLFGEMKKEFRGDSDKWMSFFSDLQETSLSFEHIFTLGAEEFGKEYKTANLNPAITKYVSTYIGALRSVSNKSWIIPVFTILDYERKLNNRGVSFIKKSFHRTLRKHLVFSFLHFNIFKEPSRDYFDRMWRLGKAINSAYIDHPQDDKKSSELVNKALQSHFHNKYVVKKVEEFKQRKEDFIEGFKEIKYKTDFKTKQYLHWLFTFMDEEMGGSVYDIKDHTIEHYLPQDPKSWNLDKKQIADHVHSIGNLMPCHIKLNSSLGSKPHNEKLEILKTSSGNKIIEDFKTCHDKGNYDFGSISSQNFLPIEKRANHLAEIMFRLSVLNFNY